MEQISTDRSLVATLGYFVGDAVRRGDAAGASDQALAYYAQVEAAHDLIARLPIASMEDAAIMAMHAYGFVGVVTENHIGGDGAAQIRADLELAVTALKTLTRFLIDQAGADPVAIGATYYMSRETFHDAEIVEAAVDPTEGRAAA